MKCPSCGNKGHRDDSLRFDVRGQVDGTLIRKCLNCGVGLSVGAFGRARVIPESIWAKMEAEWDRNFPNGVEPSDIQGDRFRSKEQRDESATRSDQGTIQSEKVRNLFSSGRDIDLEAAAKELAIAREWIETSGVTATETDILTTGGMVDTYSRVVPFFVEVAEEEFLGQRGPDNQLASPPAFGGAFRMAMDDCDDRIGEGTSAGILLLAIKILARSGFCAGVVDTGAPVSGDLDVATIRKHSLDRVGADIAVLESDAIGEGWFWQTAWTGVGSFVSYSAMLGIVKGRYPSDSPEGMEDSMMLRSGRLALGEAYPDISVVEPWLSYYAGIGLAAARSLPM